MFGVGCDKRAENSGFLHLGYTGRVDTMNAQYRPILPREFGQISQLEKLGPERLEEMKIVSSVLPFKVNNYVIEQLIDWSNVPDDPIFQLAFPNRHMLKQERYQQLQRLFRERADGTELALLIESIRQELNPHPGEQLEKNVPSLDGVRVEGLQHKYRETVLFFPKAGQTCHAYCAFCFRWPQFVGDSSMRMALSDSDQLSKYLSAHTEVSDLLLTGGDPMTMSTRRLEQYLMPFVGTELEHVQNIRFGTKALSFWPYRFVTDRDADDLLRLLERLVKAGRHVAIMAHINHPVELSTEIARRAISRILNTGAQIRSQSPILRNVNDDPRVWSSMWKEQVRHGIHPYYMFVPRDTGAKTRFDVPLARALEVFRGAVSSVSGLARTARGPSMSASAGKIEIHGIAEVGGEKVFVLNFLQAREPAWVKQPFFARFDAKASWFDDLRPAGGKSSFFFQG